MTVRRSLVVAALAIILACAEPIAPQSGVGVQPSRARNYAAAIRKARKLLTAHEPKRAEALLEATLVHEPEDAALLTLLVQAYLDQNEIGKASTLLLRALAVSPNSKEVNILMGNLLLRGHHDPEAMDRFETVLSADVTDQAARKGELNAVTELASSVRSDGHPEAALLALRHARATLPDDPKLLYELGVLANELALLPEAAEALSSAHKIDAGDGDILYALARVEIDQQRMAAAEGHMREYLATHPDDASAHYGLGHVLAMDQRIDEARAEFERSVQLQPAQTESYYQLGQIELDAQNDTAAEPLFRKTLERDATHGGALTGMGVLAFRAKEYANAERFLAAAERTAPDYGPAHYYRGLALSHLDRKVEADAELKTATELGHAVLPLAPASH